MRHGKVLKPSEVVMLATDLRKKRVEVNLKELGEEDQLRFTAAKDKEIRAWLHHKNSAESCQRQDSRPCGHAVPMAVDLERAKWG